MPIEQLAQIIGSLTNEAQLTSIAAVFFTDARTKHENSGKAPEEFNVNDAIKEAHDDAVEFFKYYQKIHSDYLKEVMKEHAGIQIATPGMAPGFAEKLKG